MGGEAEAPEEGRGEDQDQLAPHAIVGGIIGRQGAATGAAVSGGAARPWC